MSMISHFKLREYQEQLINTIARKGNGRYLCCLATGMGKTVIFSNLHMRGKVLLLSHREELVTQPLKYFKVSSAVEMGKHQAYDKEVKIVSASVQSMASRLDKYQRDTFDTIIIDEAHHATATNYRKIIEYFKYKKLLGFTATPNRADGVGLETIFDEILCNYDLRYGIENGYLSNIKCKRVNIGYNLSQVASRMGDYSSKELERAVNIDSCNRAIAQIINKEAVFPALIFAVDVKHAEAIAEAVKAEGIEAVALSAKSKNRTSSVDDFRNGKLQVLVNCSLFIEGTDLPNTQTIIIARPTKSLSLYTQMVGRGTRLADNKPYCLLIDCVGISNNPICSAPSLLGLDINDVPKRYELDIMGDLLQDIPSKVESAMDTPESWINNVKNVNLFAKMNGYNLHDVNYIKFANGDFKISFPTKEKKKIIINISAPNHLGMCNFSTSGGYRATLKAQACFDLAFSCCRSKFKEQRPLWDLGSAKRWGREAASIKQKQMIGYLNKSRLEFDISQLTKLQAISIIENLKRK